MCTPCRSFLPWTHINPSHPSKNAGLHTHLLRGRCAAGALLWLRRGCRCSALRSGGAERKGGHAEGDDAGVQRPGQREQLPRERREAAVAQITREPDQLPGGFLHLRLARPAPASMSAATHAAYPNIPCFANFACMMRHAKCGYEHDRLLVCRTCTKSQKR